MAAQVEKKSSFLTAKQRSDLHGAILDYLSSESRFSDSAAAFRREAGLSQEGNDATSRECGQLVRKWTSIVRLSRQVQDLQKRAEAAELIVKSARLQDGGVSGVSRGRGDAGGGAGSGVIPSSQPHLVSLTGHRDSIMVWKRSFYAPSDNLFCSCDVLCLPPRLVRACSSDVWVSRIVLQGRHD
jgi:hypothetical protein